jgi:hypothetical protein
MFTRRLKVRILFLVTSLTMLAVMALGSVGTAMADGIAFDAGSLGAGSIGTATFNADVSHPLGSPVTLTGNQQDIPISLPITVTDARGTGLGWSVTMGASRFKTASPIHLLAGNALRFNDASVVDASTDGLSTTPDAFASSADPGADVATTSITPVYETLTSGSGMGTYTVTVNMNLSIAAGAYSGKSYSSTFIETVSPIAG